MTMRRSTLAKSIPENVRENAIMTSWMSKKGGGNFSDAYRRRYFVLSEDYDLIWYKTEDTTIPRGVIRPLSSYEVQVLPGAEFLLKPRSGSAQDRTWSFSCEPEENRKKWIEILTRASNGIGPKKSVYKIEQRLQSQQVFIPPEDLIIQHDTILGEGSSGKVQKGKWQGTTNVAIKTLINMESLQEEDHESFYREIEMLSILRHPQIVTMFGYSRKGDETCLVTSYVEGGNLADAIADINNVELGDLLILDICLAISKGMVFLHKKGIIHRDLKPENILIEDLQKAAVKVCDFGLSYTVGRGDSQVIYGTPAYAAPELSRKGHNEKVDVYSFAITVWEMFVRKKAWGDLQFTYAIAEKVERGERPPLPKECLLTNLITKCWAQTPSDRPSFDKIHTELETLRAQMIGTGQVHRGGSTPSTPTGPSQNNSNGRMTMGAIYFNPRTNLEQDIVDEFRNGSLPWEKFVQVLGNVLEAKEECVERLQYCITGGNKKVAIGKWVNFTEWFSPLVKQSAGERGEAEKDGYTISEIADIVGHDWFFGNIGAEEVQRKLGLMNEDGGFLVRFSSSPGYYTVTAFKEKKVYHWRIGAEKKGYNRTEFDLEGHLFQSLPDAVEFFKTTGLSLPDGSIFKLARHCAKQSQLYESGFSKYVH